MSGCNGEGCFVCGPDAPDVSVRNEGSIFLFDLYTENARAWVQENVSEEAMFYGGALVVEHRYARELAQGMMDDGLTVE